MEASILWLIAYLIILGIAVILGKAILDLFPIDGAIKRIIIILVYLLVAILVAAKVIPLILMAIH